MPIEFPCNSCGKKLRVPDTAVGKKARCPNCQTVNVVAAAAEAPVAEPVATAQAVSAAEPGFDFQSQADSPADTENPYQAPSGQEQQRIPEDASSHELTHGSVKIGASIGFGWRTTMNNLGLCLLTWLTTIVIQVVFGLICVALFFALQGFLFKQGVEFITTLQADPKSALISISIFAIIVMLVTIIPSVWLMCGYIKLGLNIAKKNDPKISDIFSGSKSSIITLIAIGISKSLIQIVPLLLILLLERLIGSAIFLYGALLFYLIAIIYLQLCIDAL